MYRTLWPLYTQLWSCVFAFKTILSYTLITYYIKYTLSLDCCCKHDPRQECKSNAHVASSQDQLGSTALYTNSNAAQFTLY